MAEYVPPRVAFQQRYVLLPQMCPMEAIPWRQAVAVGGAMELLDSGHSADMAGTGPPDRMIIAVNPEEWGPERALKSFLDEYYPGATCLPVWARTPSELAVKLLPRLGRADIALGQSWKEWAQVQFGEDPGESSIQQYGCLLTGLSIILRKTYQHDVTPPVLDEILVQARVAYAQGNLLDWKPAIRLFPALSDPKKTWAQLTPSQLRSLQKAGYEIILRRLDGAHFVYLESVGDDGMLHIINTHNGERETTSYTNWAGIRAALVGEPEEPEPEPEESEPEESEPEEPQYEDPRPLPSLHMQTGVPCWLEYVERVKPSVVKVFCASMAAEAKARSPETTTIYRRWFPHQPTDPPKERAYEAAELAVAGMEHHIDSVDIAESYNELVNSNDPDNINESVEFHWWYSEALHELTGGAVRPGLLTTAVGNPLESEVELLIPAVEQVVKYNGVVCYHGYDPVGTHTLDPDGNLHEHEPRSYLIPDWRWYAGRWTYWDRVFRQHGLYPRYVLTESGLVGAVKQEFDDGSYYLHCLPHTGWKSEDCVKSNFNLYLREIAAMNAQIRDWNSQHGNRCLGYVLFTSGIGTGWDPFQVRGPEYVALANELI